MKYYSVFEPLKDTVVAFGCFDGMHKGHLAVLQELVKLGEEQHLTPVLLTFDVGGPVLTTEEEKALFAEQAGVHTMITLPQAPAGIAAFVNDELVERLGAKALVIGEGKTVAGLDAAALKAEAEAKGLTVHVVPEVCYNGIRITTDLLNEAFEQCDFEKYTALCGHPYVMLGKVEHGKALGRTVGMPTANLGVGPLKRKPLDGVYATITKLPDDKFMGLTNIGKRPSVDNEDRVTIETNIFDFARNIYGVPTCLEVHFHIRGVVKFNSLKEVQEQVQKDTQNSRNKLATIFGEAETAPAI